MDFWVNVLKFLDTRMPEPALYGWFHIMWLVIMITVTVLACITHKEDNGKHLHKVILWTSVMVILFEVYKQINYSFGYANGTITFDYQWYAFPFQFCSTPMYVGLAAGLTKKGKIHDALCAYLATYSVFAGLCVMLYPGDVFITTMGINIQTMVCHGAMVVIGVYLLYSGYVKLEHRTILKAIPVFVTVVVMAVLMNEAAFRTGLLERETFNMFQFSPYCPPSLPVYSEVQKVLDFPWCLAVYVGIFSLAAYIILLVAMLVKRVSNKQPAMHE